MGDSIAVGDAAEHIAGFCLLNDWSARDIQAWEYQPLGPFLSKSFITSISPWVVTAEALAPFRKAQPARPDGDPQPLPYLLDTRDQAAGGFDIELEVLLTTASMREQHLPAHRLTLSNTQHMYWTVAQMVAHHSVNGCQLQAGDLFGSGTLSGPQPGQFGSLLEITEGGKSRLNWRRARCVNSSRTVTKSSCAPVAAVKGLPPSASANAVARWSRRAKRAGRWNSIPTTALRRRTGCVLPWHSRVGLQRRTGQPAGAGRRRQSPTGVPGDQPARPSAGVAYRQGRAVDSVARDHRVPGRTLSTGAAAFQRPRDPCP